MNSNRLLCAIVLTLAVFQSCSDSDPAPARYSNAATIWADLTLHTIKNTPPNSPTFSSRNLGYIGVTMYECVIHGNENGRSLSGQLNGLTELPGIISDAEYNWTIALNAGQAEILRKLYSHAKAKLLTTIDSTENVIYEQELMTTTLDVAERSAAFGKEVAQAIYEWSIDDGGHEGYKYHFDPEYIFPVGAGYWMPPTFGQSTSPFPLHPYWGSNRTFLEANGSLAVPLMIPYSTEPGSEYYKQFEAVYTKRKSLTSEDMRIAAWWADDPTQSASPPGHSYNLATIAIRSSRNDIFVAAEAYAKVGIAVADAFINCWKCKYVYHAERPFPYIRSYIDPAYKQFWPEPPFPAFSSGHSTQSAAAAIVLESIYGENFALTDDTYRGRKPDFTTRIEYRSRRFNSIWETAEECAYSRLLGGIHTPHDNAEGQKQGIEIATHILALDWTK